MLKHPVYLLLLAGAASSSAFAATIDHADVDGVAYYSSATMNAIGRQKWLFTHASVGGNMVEGLLTLNQSNPGRYRLRSYDVGTEGGEGEPDYRAAPPPATTSTGLVYDCARGNPSWENKFVCFSNSMVRSGWGSNKVDAAMNKLCWIDPDADPTNYCVSMNRLEHLFPSARLVYCTIPLTGLQDDENNRRNGYNRYVRSYCAANDKLLLDVADLEAWTPAGVQQTYISGGSTNQRMYSGFAVNAGGGDWHLNALGRQQLALGWYAMAAVIASNFPSETFSFRATALTNNIVLRWPDPLACGVSNPTVHIRSSLLDFPTNVTDGTEVFTGTNRWFEHTGLTPSQTVFYTIWVSQDGTNFIPPP